MPVKRSLLTSAFLLLSVVRLDAQIVVPVKNLTAGGQHTCAVLNDGSAKCWGLSGNGRLGCRFAWTGPSGISNHIGDGPNEMGDNLAAIDLGTGKTAVQLVAGVGHTCALLNDGSAKCWGYGGMGILGYYGNRDNIGNGPNEMGNNLTAIDLGTTPWTTCVAGENVTVDGTAASDRQCGDCAAETFTSATNQQSCTPWTTCVAGERVTVNGFATADRQCGASPAPAAGAVNTGGSSPSPVLSTPSPVLSTPSSDTVKDIAASVPSPSDDNDPFVFESELNAAIRSHQMLTLCIVCSTFVVTLMLALM